ncbi:alkaline phosphatase-like [Glandiceps talaboti]
MSSLFSGLSLFWLSLHLLLIKTAVSQPGYEWNRRAQLSLEKALEREQLNRKVAKNVIFFVGDGMGIATITSARILKGQQQGKPGEEAELSFESFPHLALVKTYNTDQQVSDSAGTATAYLCGVKSKAGTLGVDDTVIKGSCRSIEHAKVSSFMEDAADSGRAAGIVTTARITHATPAAVYAKSPERGWERDTMVPGGEKAAGCSDIASQLVESARRFQVVMGGGRRELMPTSHVDPEYNDVRGNRGDGRDLINEWFHTLPDDTHNMYVVNRKQLRDVNPNDTDYLLGLFEPSHMLYDVEKDDFGAGDPSLTEMTEKAIQILQKGDEGFVLFVEAGRIDHAHHKGRAYLALTDTLALDKAVAKAMEMTDPEETLIVVTADHSHTNTIGGYPTRGNPILGKNDKEMAIDGIPYTTILYANGPGGVHLRQSYKNAGRRPNIHGVNTAAIDYRQQAAIPLQDESHGGEDVVVYATGPMSHLFHGVQEQHYIAHAIRHAACIDDDTGHCIEQLTTTAPLAATTTISQPTTSKPVHSLTSQTTHSSGCTYEPILADKWENKGKEVEMKGESISHIKEQDDDGHSDARITYMPSKIEISCLMTSSAESISSASTLRLSIVSTLGFVLAILKFNTLLGNL